MFSTIGKDSTINTTIGYDEYDSEYINESNENQMVKDIHLCYGGAGASFAGTPVSFCQKQPSYQSSNTSFRDDPNANIKQIYIGSVTIVGLFILFRILQRSY